MSPSSNPRTIDETPASPAKLRHSASGRKAVVRMLPYALLVAAIILVPRFLYRPSVEGDNYHLSVLAIIGINAILAIGLNLLMGYAGQVSLGHAAFYGIGAYVSAILTTQGIPQELIAPVSAALGMMAAVAGIMALLKVESYKLALCTGGCVLLGLLALHLGVRHWLLYAVAVAVLVGVPIFCRLSAVRLAMCYVIGAGVGFASLSLLNHTLVSAGISPWCAMLIGALFSSLVAYLIGGQALRLQGYYLAMATLGFGVIVGIVLLQWEPVTGGTSGVYGIPSLSLFGKPLDHDISRYYLVWAIVVVVMVISGNIVNSRVGRAFRAVHGSELAASSLGVDTARYKVQVFVLSAALAAIAGSLYAHFITFISPEPFGFRFSVELVVMVVIGGLGSVWGGIFGAGAITVLGEVLRSLGEVSVGKTHVALSDFDVVIFGLVLMVTMIYMPSGLVQGLVDLLRFLSDVVMRRGPWSAGSATSPTRK
jgi:branched-chain amino acid transport system permease protein